MSVWVSMMELSRVADRENAKGPANSKILVTDGRKYLSGRLRGLGVQEFRRTSGLERVIGRPKVRRVFHRFGASEGSGPPLFQRERILHLTKRFRGLGECGMRPAT